ncbi:heat shock protein 30 [Ascodesmis nigricans]|uniref:Heat shock protein 30 n=1 Tax=Ascodesmis nigricans TaxID=341454 RepID=A0A4S2MU64_9PEZI|nr:heat shock protein 30 [Ascodesmis nigricans]
MPFFPRFHTPSHTSNDLFRLFDELASFPLDAASTTTSSSSTTSRRAFTPNFDVHETKDSFILEGELPGLSDKSNNLSLEFTDNNTLLIHGKIERSQTRYTDEDGKVKTIEGSEEVKTITAATEDGEKTEGKKVEEAEKKMENKPRYWVSERSIGEFSRSFSFPGLVDVEKVTASLEHGILKVVVPKKGKPAARKIAIN